MRKKVLGLVFLGCAAVGLLLIPTFGFSQKGGGFGPKKANWADPDSVNKVFDKASNGREFVMISDLNKFLRDPVQQWATENGNTSGQLTRAQFQQFGKWYMDKVASGQLPGPGGGNKQIGGGPGQQGFDPDQFAITRFKEADKNGDGFLTEDEIMAMKGGLKDVWKQYDKNNDGKIDLEEYKAYMRDRMGGGNNATDQGGLAPIAAIIEEEWEKRPTVFRAGKLPKELMPGGVAEWFSQLDTDNDGQVGYYEWRKSGKSYEEFAKMDRNGDGLLTPEEVLWYLKTNAASDNPSVGSTVGQGPSIGSPGGQRPTFQGPPGKGDFGKGGKGGYDKGGKGGKGKDRPPKGG
jgi:Ca2+-binding EF-hand superfamily protein